MAKQPKPQAKEPAQAPEGVEHPVTGSREAMIAGILDETEPVAVEEAKEEPAQETQAEETETEGTDEQASEEAQPADEATETEPQAGEEDAAQDDTPEELKEFLTEDGRIDKKKVAEALKVQRKDQAGERLTQAERLALQEYQYLLQLRNVDPELQQALHASDARFRGAKAPAETRMTWEQVKAQARKLREEGRPEDAFELMQKHDPEKAELRAKLAAAEAEQQAGRQERLNAELRRDYASLTEKYGDPDAKVKEEMRRLIVEDGLGGRPMETIYKVAMVNLDRPVVAKKPDLKPQSKGVIPTRGTGAAKGGGSGPRQPPQKVKNENSPEIEQLAAERSRMEKFFKP